MIKVLYVDDEPDIREIAEMSLSLDPNIVVRTAASGIEALESVKEWQPHLVLLDVMMPLMDGPDVLAQLRQLDQAAGTPVVFVTARTQAEDVQRLLALGARGVVSKPFDPLSLATTVRSYL